MFDMEEDSSLSMKNLPSLIRLQSQGGSFVCLKRMVVTDVSSLDSIHLNEFVFIQDDNFSCNNCSALTVHYHGYKLLHEVNDLRLEVSEMRFASSEASTSIQSAIQDLKCFEKETFVDRRKMLLDCKNFLDQLESAFNMDIRESSTNEKSERKKSRSKVGAALGLGALAIAATACPFLIGTAATLGECLLVGAGGGIASGALGLSAYASNEQAKEAKNKVKQYANDVDRDKDLIKRIKRMRDSYKQYYSLL